MTNAEKQVFLLVILKAHQVNIHILYIYMNELNAIVYLYVQFIRMSFHAILFTKKYIFDIH